MKGFEYFLVGAFAALGALLLEIILDSLFSQFGFLEWELVILAIFVVVEELAKLFVILRKMTFPLPLRTVAGNCFWIGAGFGLLELGILSLNANSVEPGNYPALLAVISVHIVTTILTGLVLAKSQFKGYRTVLAVVPALFLHLAFNYWVLTR